MYNKTGGCTSVRDHKNNQGEFLGEGCWAETEQTKTFLSDISVLFWMIFVMHITSSTMGL